MIEKRSTTSSLWVPLAVLVMLLPACARKPPQELVDANAALDAARSSCAREYASAEFERARNMVEEINRLADDKKYKMVRTKSAEAIAKARAAEAAAQEKMARAKAEAEAAIQDAEKAIADAESAEAGQYAKGDLRAARSRLEEARKMARSSDCNYPKVTEAARNAADLASSARSEAIAEKRRLEEEARRAEEERLRRLEEERRAREAAAARRPASYTVARGDSLWRIAEMQTHYSNPFQWPLIYKANRSQIKDPDLIYPDQVFKIPRELSQDEIDHAIREAKNRVWPVPNYLYDGK